MDEDGKFDQDAKEEFSFERGVRVRKLRDPRLEQKSSLDQFYEPGETDAERRKRFQSLSKQNIQMLMKWRPTTAKELGIEARWLKRFQDDGLAYINQKSKENIANLAAFFGLDSPIDFWRDDLIQRLKMPGPSLKQVEGWKHSKYWPCAEKLLALLDTGDYDHVAKLIDTLHDFEMDSSAKEQQVTPKKGTLAEIVKKRKK